MNTGVLVKYKDSVGNHVGILLGQDTWHDQGGPYEVWEILSRGGSVVWLPADAFEVINET
jgi:hypothetical protein